VPEQETQIPARVFSGTDGQPDSLDWDGDSPLLPQGPDWPAGISAVHQAPRPQSGPHGLRFTIAISQLPTDKWPGDDGDVTLAGAIMDRLIHNADNINTRCESMRKRQTKLTGTATSEYEEKPWVSLL